MHGYKGLGFRWTRGAGELGVGIPWHRCRYSLHSGRGHNVDGHLPPIELTPAACENMAMMTIYSAQGR